MVRMCSVLASRSSIATFFSRVSGVVDPALDLFGERSLAKEIGCVPGDLP